MPTLASLLAQAESHQTSPSPAKPESPTGRMLTSSSVVPNDTGKRRTSGGGHNRPHRRLCLPHTPSCLAVSRFHKRCIISGSSDRTSRIWSIETGAVTRVLRGHGGEVSCLSVSEESPTVTSGAIDGSIRVFSTLTGSCTRCIEVMTPVTQWTLTVRW